MDDQPGALRIKLSMAERRLLDAQTDLSNARALLRKASARAHSLTLIIKATAICLAAPPDLPAARSLLHSASEVAQGVADMQPTAGGEDDVVALSDALEDLRKGASEALFQIVAGDNSVGVKLLIGALERLEIFLDPSMGPTEKAEG